MNEKDKKEISKFMSYVLRHRPDSVGIQLTEDGWVSTDELINKTSQYHLPINREILEEIVATNDKKRFAFNEDKTQIRANQGHSVEVALGLAPSCPPEFLYHGTIEKFIDAIKKEGLQKMSRHHVHLSKDIETATAVGSRRGKPVILTIRSGEMQKDGYTFFLSENGVWLTDSVDANYIEF